MSGQIMFPAESSIWTCNADFTGPLIIEALTGTRGKVTIPLADLRGFVAKMRSAHAVDEARDVSEAKHLKAMKLTEKLLDASEKRSRRKTRMEPFEPTSFAQGKPVRGQRVLCYWRQLGSKPYEQAYCEVVDAWNDARLNDAEPPVFWMAVPEQPEITKEE